MKFQNVNHNVKKMSLVLPVAAALLGLAETAQAEQAKRSMWFLDSQGVNLHPDRTSGPYSNVWNIRDRVQQLRMWHVRSVFKFDNAETRYKVRTLAENGIKSTLSWGYVTNMTDLVNITRDWSGWLDAVEGPNEPDVGSNRFPFNFPQGAKDYQRDMYNAIKGSNINWLPVIMFSTADHSQLGNVGNMETYNWNYGGKTADYAGGHYYADAGDPQEQHMDGWFFRFTRAANPNNPIIVTEAGYPTDSTHKAYVSEETHAKYAPRILLEHFRRGVNRTFLYELYDTGDAGHNGFGLLRSNNTEKPAFQTIRNLNNILHDGGANQWSFTPGSLNLSGFHGDVRYVLLQKSNGRFYVILWSAVRSGAGNRAMTLNLGRSFANIKKYDPRWGTGVSWSGGNQSSVWVDVPEYPIVFELY